MSVYVDTPVQYAEEVKGYVGHPRATAKWCHMYADTLDELHRMASRLGLLLAWFQPHPRLPHYDLVPSKRAKAISLGAIAVTRREVAEHMRARAQQPAPTATRRRTHEER